VAEPLPEQALESVVTASEITQHRFDLERRGFNQKQVTDFLQSVANSLDDAQRREAEMRSRLGKAVRRAEAAEKAARSNSPHTSEATREVGDEVAQVLEAARVAGEQRLSAAEQSAAKLLANAKRKAAKLRAEADAVLNERQLEADAAAADIVSQARAEVQEERDQAAAEAKATREGAANRIARVRDECDGLILEAEEARAQILEDMDRRRRDARAQVERLRVGRDRLMRSYEVVRRTLEETTVELKSSLAEAKVKGDTAARVVSAEPLANRQQLEVELADAKLIGRITTSVNTPDPESVARTDATEVRSPALPRKLDPPQVPNIDLRAESAPLSRTGGGKPTAPRPPAVAPVLKASTDESSAAAGEDVTDDELAALEDNDLNVVEPADEIEQVVAVPCERTSVDAGHTLFELLRIQSKPSPTQAPAIALRDGDVRDGDVTVAPANDTPSEASTESASTDDTPSETSTDSASTDDTPSETSTDSASTDDTSADSASADDTSTDGMSADDTPSEASTDDTSADSASTDSASTDDTSADDASTDSTAEPQGSGEKSVDALTNAEANDAAIDADGTVTSAVVSAEAVDPAQMEAQRDAVIAEASKQLERRLKRALADEQNDLLAGLRGTRDKRVELTTLIGDVDEQLKRYVIAIHDVAVTAYGAGADLVDAEPRAGELPAGAVEELLVSDVVEPIRDRLAALDADESALANDHTEPVRAFYRQRKNDHLNDAASRLAQLLCVAGVCDALPDDAPLPWSGKEPTS